MRGPIFFEKAKFWYEDGIIYIEFKNEDWAQRLQESSMEEYISAINKLCENKATPFLIDLRKVVGTYTIAAAKLFAGNQKLKNIRVAEAYVLNSIGTRLSISSFKRIYDPGTPYEIFDEIQPAIDYCKSFNT